MGGKSIITESYNTGEIKTKVNGLAGGIVGGIVGGSYNSGSTVEISNSYNAGKIEVGTSGYGGILGNIDDYASAKISYCHNVGTLSDSKPNKGTMVGNQNGTYTGFSNYWLETCNASYSVGSNSTVGNKYTAAQMEVQSNFSGWDFTNIWQIDTIKGYPVLQ